MSMYGMYHPMSLRLESRWSSFFDRDLTYEIRSFILIWSNHLQFMKVKFSRSWNWRKKGHCDQTSVSVILVTHEWRISQCDLSLVRVVLIFCVRISKRALHLFALPLKLEGDDWRRLKSKLLRTDVSEKPDGPWFGESYLLIIHYQLDLIKRYEIWTGK